MRDVVDHLFSQINAVPQIAYETEEAEVIAGLTATGFWHCRRSLYGSFIKAGCEDSAESVRLYGSVICI